MLLQTLQKLTGTLLLPFTLITAGSVIVKVEIVTTIKINFNHNRCSENCTQDHMISMYSLTICLVSIVILQE